MGSTGAGPAAGAGGAVGVMRPAPIAAPGSAMPPGAGAPGPPRPPPPPPPPPNPKLTPMFCPAGLYVKVSGSRYDIAPDAVIGMYIRFVVGLNAMGAQLCAPAALGEIEID